MDTELAKLIIMSILYVAGVSPPTLAEILNKLDGQQSAREIMAALFPAIDWRAIVEAEVVEEGAPESISDVIEEGT